MEPERDAILMHRADNVVVALGDLGAGHRLAETGVVLREDVRRGHKIAIRAISGGENVRRYGQSIGIARCAIGAGAHVHTHNLAPDPAPDPALDLAPDPAPDPARARRPAGLAPAENPLQFNGFHRKDGRVGTRNHIGILTTVNCAGSVARFIAEAAERSDWLGEMTHVDGVVPIVHHSGCAMAGDDAGYRALFRTLTGYARHPNFAAILMVGLGCEVMQIPDLIGAGRMREDDTFRYLTIQQTGGTRRTVERGLAILRELAEAANRARRAPAPLSRLTVGLQCGGSDSYSGITANPALGHASDLLVRHGATSILSETPEIYGAQHVLIRRAVSAEVGRKLAERIAWWEDHVARNGGEMNNNPSPGNKRGGLTTIVEKSLGAVAKAGRAPLRGVYRFGEPITGSGLVFMDSPGYDPCSVTGQIASGATLIAFTTGRGSVSGFKPAPGIKLATNTQMYERLREDMDLNCGDIVTHGTSIEDKGREIFDLMIRIASGERSKSEALGFGGAEFVPWQIGAVM